MGGATAGCIPLLLPCRAAPAPQTAGAGLRRHKGAALQRRALGGQRRWGAERVSPWLYKGIREQKWPKVPRLDMFKGNAWPGQQDPDKHLTTKWGLLVRPSPKEQPEFAKVTRRAAVAVREFAEMGFSPPVISALREQGIERPSPIQQLACPLALKGKTVLMAAQTGTGKTAAFLAPALQRLRGRLDGGLETRPQRPAILVLSPTVELVHQTYGVARRLGLSLGLEVRKLYGGMSREEKNTALCQSGPYHILVANLEQYLLHRDRGHIVDSDLVTVCIDEADTVLGCSASPLAREADKEMLHELARPLLLKQFERDSYLGRHKVQFLIACAVLNQPMMAFVSEWIPHVHFAKAPGLHVAPPSLRHFFWYARSEKSGMKFDYLRAILGRHGVIAHDSVHRERQQAQRNFWFPDAISFEPPARGPLASGSWVDNKGLAKHKRDVPADTTRRSYLDEYRPPLMLDAGGLSQTSPFLPPGPGQQEQQQQALAERAATALVPVSAPPPLLIRDPPQPVMRWGATRLKAAPFTALPGLMPTARPLRGARTVVFVKNNEVARRLGMQLENVGYRVAFLQRVETHMRAQTRIAEFEKWAQGECNVLIATDIASRGLDHFVEVVINYDLPTTTGDYLHRCGRAGRFGRAGVVHNLVDDKFTVPRVFAHRLEHKLARGKPLYDIAMEAEHLRVDITQWWKRKVSRLKHRWRKRVFRGFMTPKEQKQAEYDLQEVMEGQPPNPRAPLGLPHGEPFPLKKAYKVWWQQSWQYNLTTRGTGSYELRSKPVGKLLKEQVSRHSMIAEGPGDARASSFYKPQAKQKIIDRVKKFGRFGHLATPIRKLFKHDGQIQPGQFTRQEYVSEPSMFPS
eukprot:TRINITY_DN16159_c0_g1_i1.p1 TRINITY_DN16159_c0_g1~~TRINITY_DN16159_c0_g1_i1.p1  ORF type:complete len:882 (+),score=297.69 TRINITY_DN16159_c0_g1_i1:75-2648(+)